MKASTDVRRVFRKQFNSGDLDIIKHPITADSNVKTVALGVREII